MNDQYNSYDTMSIIFWLNKFFLLYLQNIFTYTKQKNNFKMGNIQNANYKAFEKLIY